MNAHAEGMLPLSHSFRFGHLGQFARKSSEAEFRQVRESARSELVAPRQSIGASEFVRPTPIKKVSTTRQPEARATQSEAEPSLLVGTCWLGAHSAQGAQPGGQKRRFLIGVGRRSEDAKTDRRFARRDSKLEAKRKQTRAFTAVGLAESEESRLNLHLQIHSVA